MLGSAVTRIRGLIQGYRWQWLAASHNTEDIPISALIGPLRYDVVALRDLLLCYLAHKDLAKDDFGRFVAEARSERFYDWQFVKHGIEHPEETRDPATFARVFARSVRQTVDMWESFQRQGFDRKSPIEVRITDRLLPADSGKRVNARYILGDGRHRLACLMLLGYSTLPRDYYRVRWFRRLRPNDATWLLTRKGLIPAEDYFAFLSTVYESPQPWRDREAFLRDIRDRIPDRLDEVRSVLDVDGFGG